MKLLLDTNALIWLGQDHPRLTRAARDAIAAPTTVTLFSIVSLWEAAIKARAHGLAADPADLRRRALGADLTMLALTPAHLDALAQAPMLHRDPFDHLLIAQAMAEDATIVTADRMFPRYPFRLLAL